MVFFAVILFGCTYIPYHKQKKPTKTFSKCIFAPFHVVFPLYILGVGNFAKNTQNGGGQGQNSCFFLQLYCLVAPIFHIKSRKNQPKCILNVFLDHSMWFFHCIFWVWEISTKTPKMGKGKAKILGFFSRYIVWLLLYSISKAEKNSQNVF